MLRWLPPLSATFAVGILCLLVCLVAPAGFAQAEAEGAAQDAAEGAADEAVPEAVGRSGTNWLDWRDYRLSFGLGFGVESRSVHGVIDGIVWTRNGTAPQFEINTADTERWPNTDVTVSLSGPTIPLDFQLLLPEFDLPTRPRLFAEGGYVVNLAKTRLAGNAGRERADWGDTSQGAASIALGRVEQEVNQRNSWFLGLGAAFKLPIDSYDTRLGVSVRYHQDRMRLTRRMQFRPAGDPTGVFEQSDSVDHVIQEVMPGVALEIDLDKRGPILIGVFLNCYIGIPIDDAPETTTITSEFALAHPGDHIDYYFSSDSPRYTGTIGLRFSWVGH